ncbi:MAG: PstS family phosphate ABC transporter substrate-binding protein [Planctomycetes bacterium]|nr:PstS family phosphate ABC transporter substrate-binding protein [Planctomycetota bacterium]
MSSTSRILSTACAAAALGVALSAQVQVDRQIPAYAKTAAVSGSIKSVGSDTMNNLMTLWAEGFNRAYPNVEVEIEGKGSSTAPPALIEGTATFGPMSREMKAKELDDFEKEFGYKPTGLATGIDMLAVYVHKDNPIAAAGLTLQQVDAIFSKTRKGGAESDVRTWGDLGLSGDWADKPISLFGRNSASGTYGFFKEKALFGGDFKDEVKEQSGSASVVQGVASDKYAIGYSGIGYITADVLAVPLGKAADSLIAADAANVAKYPLSRPLFVYLNYKPNSQLDPLRREFVRYVFSAEGQSVVLKDGYLPLSFAQCRAALAKVGLELQPVPAAVEAAGKGEGAVKHDK